MANSRFPDGWNWDETAWRGCVFGYGKLAAAALVDSVVDPPVTGDR